MRRGTGRARAASSLSCANHSGARPSAAASGIPCTLPDGLVSGVLRSPWASIQITPPGCPAAAARPASVPDRDRVVAAEHERPRALAHGLLDERRELRAGVEDLREVARALVHERERLRHRRDDVAAVGDGKPDLGQPLVEAGVADRRRPHVDTAPGLAEVEGCTDDRDGTPHGAEPYLGGAAGATLCSRGEVAQLVEHTAENRGVAGSSPALAIPSASPASRLRRCAFHSLGRLAVRFVLLMPIHSMPKRLPVANQV